MTKPPRTCTVPEVPGAAAGAIDVAVIILDVATFTFGAMRSLKSARSRTVEPCATFVASGRTG